MLTFQIFDGKYFDGWSVSFTKYCIGLKFDGFNFDGLAGKHQKRQNFPLYGSCAYFSRVLAVVTEMSIKNLGLAGS